MARLLRKSIIWTILICFSLYSFTGCGSSSSTGNLEKYTTLEYSEVAKFDATKDEFLTAGKNALQHSGYRLTIDNEQAGLIGGEYPSETLLPEEVRGAEPEHPTVGTIVATVVGIVLLVGIVALLFGQHSGNHDETSASADADVSFSSPAQTYRYLVTINVRESDQYSTTAGITCVRETLEGDTVVSTTTVQNKYLNYEIFDAIQEQLISMPRK